MDEGIKGLMSALGRMLQAEHEAKVGKAPKYPAIQSKLAEPKKKKKERKLTGEEIFESIMK